MIYQIDYSATSSGKMVSMTKRRIRWRWGVANKEALKKGKVGSECRGYEHEVTLVWSIASGKHQIIDDGKEVHYSIGRRAEGKFQHSWTGCNNRVFTIVAFASAPLHSRSGFKQFDLLIDGVSYDFFPRIYELGTTAEMMRMPVPVVSPLSSATSSTCRRSVTSSNNNYYTRGLSHKEHRSDRESRRSRRHDHHMQTESQWARSSSSRNKRAHNQDDNIIQTQQPELVVQDLLSSPTVSLLDMESPSAESTGTYWDQPTVSPMPAPTAASVDQFHNYNASPNQPPSYEAVWGSIMNAYDDTTNNIPLTATATATANTSSATTTTAVTACMQDMSNLQINTSPPTQPTDHGFMKQNNFTMDSPRDVTDIDNVLKNLVNLDDISSQVMKGYSKQKYDEEQREQSRTRSLCELKSMQRSSNTTATGQKKEIMKTHQPVVTNPTGALVVYGQPQHQPQGYNNYSYSVPNMYMSH